MSLLTERNIIALNETFDKDNFHPMDAYDHLMSLSNWDVKGIAEKFEDITYKNKRSFSKSIISLMDDYLNLTIQKTIK